MLDEYLREVLRQVLPRSPVPTVGQKRLLQAALGDAASAASAWEQWKAEDPAWEQWRTGEELQALDPGTYHLIPLLYRSLTSSGVEDPVVEKLRGVYRYTWARNRTLLPRLFALLRSLEEQGCEPLLRGDAALLLQHYRDTGLRSIDRLAVLIRPTHLRRAVDRLRQEGWQAPSALPDPTRDSVLTCRDSTGLPLDLHWRLLPFHRRRLNIPPGRACTTGSQPPPPRGYPAQFWGRWPPSPQFWGSQPRHPKGTRPRGCDPAPLGTPAQFRGEAPTPPARGLSYEDPWEASVPIAWEDQSGQTIASADQLLCLCAAGTRGASTSRYHQSASPRTIAGFSRRRLRLLPWMVDALVLLRSGQDGLDWNRLPTQAEENGLRLRLSDALSLLQSLDAPVPESVCERLLESPAPARERLEHALYQYHPTWAASLVRQRKRLIG